MRRAALIVIAILLPACAREDAAILCDQAVAALRLDDLVAAEIAAERAAARGGSDAYAARDFVLGFAAFRRCEAEETRFFGPLQAADAADQAIAHGEAALAHWSRAVSRRGDWPEARRNAERAALKLAILRERRAEADKLSQKKSQPMPPPPAPVPAPRPPLPDETKLPPVEPHMTEVPPEMVARILDRLAEKEREKVKVRHAQREARRADVEKDW